MLVKEKLTMVKKVLLCFMLGVATISSGCGKQVSSEKSNVVDMLEVMILRSKTPSLIHIMQNQNLVKLNLTVHWNYRKI